jgi:hypothetical protein
MSQYIYSGALRRFAVNIFKDADAVLTIAVSGNRPCDTALFRSVASVIAYPGIADGHPSLSQCDAILCGVDDLAIVQAGLTAADPANTATAALAIRGPVDRFTADAFETIATLSARLGLTLVSQQADLVDFGRDKEIAFILTRPPDGGRDDPISLLKSAVLLEAHSLHEAALERVQQFNERPPDPLARIDEAAIDRTYDVEPFVTADRTAQAVDELTAGGGETAVGSAPRRRSAVSGPGHERRLSIHFDQFYHSDGESRLRRLARSLALPEHAEVVARIPDPTLSAFWPALTAEIARLGVTIKVFQDPECHGTANPCAAGFVAAMAQDARIAVYCADFEADVPGWDYDLLRAADAAEGRMFALKISEHKTRNYAMHTDTEPAPGVMQAVSRAWLETCGAWSVPGLSAGVFQSLVAYHFDRADYGPIACACHQRWERENSTAGSPALCGQWCASLSCRGGRMTPLP